MSHKINIQSAKVLVVDDEPEITEIVETFLTEAGYQRVVFLRATRGWDVNGLPVLAKGG